MARSYRMTPKRRAALRKAQLASAKKRSRLGSAKAHVSRNRGKYAGAAAALGIAALTVRHKKSGSSLGFSRRKGSMQATTTHQPVQFNSAGFRVGGGSQTVYGVSTPSRALSLGRNGNRFHIGIGSHDLVYTHRSLGKARSTVTGTKTRNPVDHDTIPFYNSQSSKSWPHVDPAKARKQNQKLRRLGIVE